MPRKSSHTDESLGDLSKQRASKACNRCRAKKAKCSGGYPCSKCKSSDAVCIFGYARKSKRKTFPEHYVRALEMQQFKLVAGLQTMYFMLLAANSWPGPQLAKREGNPLTHDILESLGLLESDQDEDLEPDMDDDDFDQRFDRGGASIIESPERSQRDLDQWPQSSSQEQSASPPGMVPQQQDHSQCSGTRPHADSWYPQPVQPSDVSYPSTELPTGFVLRPPPRMTAPLLSTSPSSRSMEGTRWKASSCHDAWWLEDSQLAREIPQPNVGFLPGIPAAHLEPITHITMALALHDQDTYLTDPGTYGCDFDLE